MDEMDLYDGFVCGICGSSHELCNCDSEPKSDLEKLLDVIEEDVKVSSMLGLFQLGLGVKVLEDRLWGINDALAQRCNNIQHKILKDT